MLRKAKIETADAEVAATHEIMKAMDRFYMTSEIDAKQRVLLHVSMRHLSGQLKTSDSGVWLKLL